MISVYSTGFWVWRAIRSTEKISSVMND